MSHELVPLPGRRDPSNGQSANGPVSSPKHVPDEGQVYDPLVPARFVDTDSQSAGQMQWDLPPADALWEGFEAAKQARRGAEKADRDAEWARRHGLPGFASLRESDAADNRQLGWDWGDLRTWSILLAMFFGFLLFALFVYSMPEARMNQGNLPFSEPPIHVYMCLKELPGL